MTPVERPIIFSGSMVRALLAGHKTQTRRLVTLPPWAWLLGADLSGAVPEDGGLQVPCRNSDHPVGRLPNPWGFPNGVAGPDGRAAIIVPTRLWVRETWRAWERDSDGLDHIWYQADDARLPIPNTKAASEFVVGRFDRWRSSIHLPRWASRLTLEVTEVRAERLQDISEQDAQAEGAGWDETDGSWPPGRQSPCPACSGKAYGLPALCHPLGKGPPWRCEFANLWDAINGKRAPWAENPWVWALTFTVARAESLPGSRLQPLEVRAP